MDQRTQALVELAGRHVNDARRSIQVERTIFNYGCNIEVECRPTVENLRLIQQRLDVASNFDITLEPDFTGCERLGNLIYVSLAMEFPDSCINVVVKYNDHIDVTFSFNNKPNQGK